MKVIIGCCNQEVQVVISVPAISRGSNCIIINNLECGGMELPSERWVGPVGFRENFRNSLWGIFILRCQWYCQMGMSVGQFSSVTQSSPTVCDSMDTSTPGFPVHHQLPEFTQTHVHWVGDAIQPSPPLSFPSPPAYNLSQHQDLFKWVTSSHQVAMCIGVSASASVLPVNIQDWFPLGWTSCCPKDSQESSPTP